MRKLEMAIGLISGLLAWSAQASPAAATDSTTYRADCQFQAEVPAPKPRFCYASLGYQVQGAQVSSVRIGVACDTAFMQNDVAVYQSDAQGDQIVPSKPSTPGVQLSSSGSLLVAGAHAAVLDFSSRKIQGSCTVRPIVAQPAARN